MQSVLLLFAFVITVFELVDSSEVAKPINMPTTSTTSATAAVSRHRMDCRYTSHVPVRELHAPSSAEFPIATGESEIRIQSTVQEADGKTPIHDPVSSSGSSSIESTELESTP